MTIKKNLALPLHQRILSALKLAPMNTATLEKVLSANRSTLDHSLRKLSMKTLIAKNGDDWCLA